VSEDTWDLNSVYPSMDSGEYHRDRDELVSLSAQVVQILENDSNRSDPPGKWFPGVIEKLNRLSDLSENLSSYTYAVWSTDTSDEKAQRELDNLESRSLAVKDALVRFRALLPGLSGDWETLLADPAVSGYRFWLNEQLFLASRQMSPPEEGLATDLQRCGGDAWDRLHSKLSSELSRDWVGGKKTVTQLRAMAFDPDRSVRRNAWQEETAAWKSAEISFAAALNGVKGTAVTLNLRRGWGSTLEKSLTQNRLSRKALDSMLGVMTESLPGFRRYFSAKARMLGLNKLSWYDLFAPVGKSDKRWTWEEVTEFIPRMFGTLSVEMGDFARKAFSRKWIDVLPRNGKVGGAYCTGMPLAGESRILCNFDGSFESVFTVAHELGHAWHGEVMKDLPGLNRHYPMTLAETASIFSETLVFRAALAEGSTDLRASLLDTYLTGASQVIVDILSRFHFEAGLLRCRPDGELSPGELTRMMLDAQELTYGDALAEDERHGWMWAVKGHYYSPDLAFYNFPYAFGQLFGAGLYSLFQESPDDFPERYRTLLRRTGSDDAAGVARSAGFDIEAPDFWRKGIKTVMELAGEFEELSGSIQHRQPG
jgi:pepF/M3 family oligoendopeptidase